MGRNSGHEGMCFRCGAAPPRSEIYVAPAANPAESVMTQRKIDAEYILTIAEAIQQVEISPDAAERMAALQKRFNDTALAQASRVPFEGEPADFPRLLHLYRDEER